MQSHPTRKKGRQAGFTLIEIMVVVLIIGLLVGLVGPNVWNTLFRGQIKSAEAQISRLHGALDDYRMQNSRYPDSLDVLTEENPVTGEKWIQRIPLDPWDNEYQYEFNADGDPVITSFGADGEPGGDGANADISSITIGKVDE